MECRELDLQLQAYVDGELDASNYLTVQKHLLTCARCQARVTELQQLSKALKAPSLRFSAPPGLAEKILPATPAARPGFRASWWFVPVAFAAGMLMVWWLPRLAAFRRDDALAREVVSDHVRSLMVSHLADVASTDQHTVKPWFNGKLDFSPRTKDFAPQGFPLIGGRLDYLDQRAVAALVYRRDKHPINVFTWPTPEPDSGSPRWQWEDGYQIAHWRSHGFQYWVISDLNVGELGEMVKLLRSE